MNRLVLFVEHHGEVIGGGQISLLSLMRSLRGFRALCVCAPGGLAGTYAAAGVECQTLDMPPLRPWRLGGVILAVWRLARLARSRGASVLHANSSRAMFYAAVAGRLAGVPAVWHVRVGGDDGAWDRFLAARSAIVIAISRAVAARFPGLPATKVRVVYNGIDVDEVAGGDGAAWRRRLGLEDRPVIGMLAQLIELKRPEDFVQAAALVRRHHPAAAFVLAGAEIGTEGVLQRLQEQVRREGLEADFHFLGFCDDVAGILAMCDAVALTSREEAFGRVLIEAMAAGRPVVATAVGGVPEVVVEGETGFMVRCGDTAALASALGILLNDPSTAARMGAAGQARARRVFSLEAHVRQIEALYDDIVVPTN